MALNSEFVSRCNDIRTSAKELLNNRVARLDDMQHVSDGVTLTAAPTTLRMSMGEVTKKKKITLCSFVRSELMVRCVCTGLLGNKRSDVCLRVRCT